MRLCVACLLVALCVTGQPAPWKERIERGHMLYSNLTGIPNADPLNAPMLANGYLGTLAFSNATYLAGVYSGLKGNTPSHRARLPSTNAILIDNATPLAAGLDMERGEFLVHSVVGQCTVQQRLYAHRHFRHLLVHEISLVDPIECPSVELSLRYNQGGPSADFHFTEHPRALSGCALITGTIAQPETPDSQVIQIAQCATTLPTATVLSHPQLFLTVLSSTLDDPDPKGAVQSEYQQFMQAGASQLLAIHREAWKEAWEAGRIDIIGNLTLAQQVNATQFALLSNLRADWPYGISPGGIGTNAYSGHVFWDMETWVYPSFLLLHAPTAASMLQYRIQRLPAALQKAAFYGLEGAWFPWESAFTGVECCPWDGGANPEGLLEIHISGDIAFAVQQYLRCADSSSRQRFLQEGGLELLAEIANFWASRVRPGEAPGDPYEIHNVQPPDESAGRVNNSLYTNAVASLSLEIAARVLRQMGRSPPPLWEEIAHNMLLPFNSTWNLHPEYQGYAGEMINQADVILTQYPLGMQFTNSVMHHDLAYYQAKTRKNGYFTGDNAYSIAWLALGEYQRGVEQYRLSFLHIKGPFDVWWEKVQGGHAHFLTGAGGFLQNLLFGFGGIRIEEEALRFHPLPLPDAAGYSFQDVDYRNASFSATFRNGRLTLSTPTAPLCVRPHQSVPVLYNSTMVFESGSFPLLIQERSLCP